MSGHPIASIVADGLKVPKGGFRDYIAARVPVVLETAAEIQGMDLPGTLAVILGRVMFYYDATDGSSAHNGTTVLVSLDGRRYKGSASLPAGSVTNTELAAGAAVANIGFTPLQQGGGTGQGTNKVRIGWLGSTLGLQVDSSNFGAVWPIATIGNVRVDTASQGLTSTEKANARANLDLGNAALATMGVAGGVATLDGSGFVPSSQLPSHIDDIIDYASVSAFPATGAKNKIYYAVDVQKQYRWTGSVYAEIIPAPGTTDALTEGSSNLYHTAARVLAALAANATTAKSNLGLAAVASSGSAADLSTGTIPDARFPGTDTSITDWNNAKEPHKVYWASGAANAPFAGDIHVRFIGDKNGSWGHQEAVSYFSSLTARRRLDGGTWGPWETVYRTRPEIGGLFNAGSNITITYNAGTGKYDISATGTLGGSTAASSVTFSPAGNIASTSVQGAIEELDAEKTTIAATDARYLRKLSSGRLSTADASAIDHSGNSSANATNTSEINTLLSSLPSGGVLELANGIIYVDPLATVSNKTIVVEGLGKRISTIVLKGSSGNFLTFSQNSQNLRTILRKCSVLKHSDASTSGAALRVEYPVVSSHLANTAIVEDVECRGVNGTTTFGALFRPVNAWNTKWHDLEFEGIDGSPSSAVAAVDLLGKCTIAHGDMVKAFWAQYGGTRYEGGYFSEGGYLSRYHIVACDWIAFLDNGQDAPGASFHMMHGETFVGGLKLLNHPQIDINDLLVYKRLSSTQNWTMVWLEGSSGYSQDVCTVRGVRGWGAKGASAGGTAVGLVVDDSDGGMGSDIMLWDMDLGADLFNNSSWRLEFGHSNVTTLHQNVPGSANISTYSLPLSP